MLDHVHDWRGEGLSAGRRRLGAWFAGLGDRLVAVDVDGTTAYVVREDVDALAASCPSEAVRFLPGHDQWVIGRHQGRPRHLAVTTRPHEAAARQTAVSVSPLLRESRVMVTGDAEVVAHTRANDDQQHPVRPSIRRAEPPLVLIPPLENP